MGLNKFQVTKCLAIIDKLINWAICAPFVDPVDITKEEAPDYYEIIKNPICLSEIKRKMQAGEYTSLSEYEKDVNLVWSNAVEYNGEDTLYAHMANEASLWFGKKMTKFPATAEEEWAGKLQRASKELLEVLSHPPPELDPSGKLTMSEETEEDKN